MIANSENQTSSGTAAQTTSTNRNLNSDPIQQMTNKTNKTESGEEIAMLKQAAAKFDCAASSLKNNIKSGKLAATQANEKAPFMVRLSDVERFLRDTPGIASIFHPAADKPAEAMTAETGAPVAIDKKSETQPPVVQATQAPVEAATKTAKLASGNVDHKHATGVPDVQADPSTQVPADGTKRRRRRRGKGGGGSESPTTAGIRPPVLKALAGTTPQERLRIAACLTELVGLVASA